MNDENVKKLLDRFEYVLRVLPILLEKFVELFLILS